METLWPTLVVILVAAPLFAVARRWRSERWRSRGDAVVRWGEGSGWKAGDLADLREAEHLLATAGEPGDLGGWARPPRVACEIGKILLRELPSGRLVVLDYFRHVERGAHRLLAALEVSSLAPDFTIDRLGSLAPGKRSAGVPARLRPALKQLLERLRPPIRLRLFAGRLFLSTPGELTPANADALATELAAVEQMLPRDPGAAAGR